MHFSRIHSFVAIVVLSISAPATGQFWDYQYVDVTGEVNAEANVTATVPGISSTATDSEDLTDFIVLPNPAVLDVTGSGGVAASVAESFLDGCPTRAFSRVGGTTAYDLDGDGDDITVVVESRLRQESAVIRGALLGGTFVSTSSEHEVEQADSVTLVLPVRVAGHPLGGLVTLDGFTVESSATGGIGGQTVCSWEWFHDRNSNGVIDPTEISLAAQVGIVFPNGLFTGPAVSFQAPRGFHLLRVTYFRDSQDADGSGSCSSPSSSTNEVKDAATLQLSLS